MEKNLFVIRFVAPHFAKERKRKETERRAAKNIVGPVLRLASSIEWFTAGQWVKDRLKGDRKKSPKELVGRKNFSQRINFCALVLRHIILAVKHMLKAQAEATGTNLILELAQSEI